MMSVFKFIKKLIYMISTTNVKRFLGICLMAMVLMSTYSCSSGDESNTAETPAPPTPAEITSAGMGAADHVGYVLPSPFEIAALIKRTGINYEEGILNSLDNQTLYNTNYTKSLNLGVYGADLGLIFVFDQTQDAISYFKTVKKLAEDLGVLGAFEQSTLQRVENNLGNQDSLINIASMAFSRADMYLKENDRGSVSTLVLAGGWIESLYLATKFGEATMDKEVLKRVGEQKKSLETLIDMVGEYKENSEGFTTFFAGLESLKLSFDKVKITYTEKPSVAHPNDKKTTIETVSDIEISEEVFKEIAEKVLAIRSQIIS